MIDLPKWVMDLQKTQNDVQFGRIPLELVKAHGKITKVIGTQTIQTKFRENNEAQIFMLDHVRTAVGKKVDGTITFNVVCKGGRVTQIDTVNHVVYNYGL